MIVLNTQELLMMRHSVDIMIVQTIKYSLKMGHAKIVKSIQDHQKIRRNVSKIHAVIINGWMREVYVTLVANILYPPMIEDHVLK